MTVRAKGGASARTPDVALIVRATGPDARAVVRFRAVHGWPSLDASRAHVATHGVATLRVPPHSSASRSFGADGEEIPPTVAVSVWDARDAAGRALPFGPATLLVPWPLPAEVTIALPRGVVVEGRVLGSDRRPRAGVRVVAAVDESAMTAGGDGLRALAVTDSAADGTFRFDTLPAGSLVLLAIGPGRRHIARVATVSDTSSVELVIAE